MGSVSVPISSDGMDYEVAVTVERVTVPGQEPVRHTVQDATITSAVLQHLIGILCSQMYSMKGTASIRLTLEISGESQSSQ